MGYVLRLLTTQPAGNVTVWFTGGRLGPPPYEWTQPDFSGLAGWDPAWDLDPESATAAWSLVAYYGVGKGHKMADVINAEADLTLAPAGLHYRTAGVGGPL